MIYVGSPYTHENPKIVEDRYNLVLAYCAHLFKKGTVCFSPVVHCHEIAKRFFLPTDALFWRGYNMAMLRRAETLHVLCLEGWMLSTGLRTERDMANDLFIPTYYINWPLC